VIKTMLVNWVKEIVNPNDSSMIGLTRLKSQIRYENNPYKSNIIKNSYDFKISEVLKG